MLGPIAVIIIDFRDQIITSVGQCLYSQATQNNRWEGYGASPFAYKVVVALRLDYGSIM